MEKTRLADLVNILHLTCRHQGLNLCCTRLTINHRAIWTAKICTKDINADFSQASISCHCDIAVHVLHAMFLLEANYMTK